MENQNVYLRLYEMGMVNSAAEFNNEMARMKRITGQIDFLDGEIIKWFNDRCKYGSVDGAIRKNHFSEASIIHFN